MFGGGRKNDKDKKDDGNSLSSVMAPEGPKKGSSSITGFDPEGLERAAKAARDLDSSKNAGSAIELIKTQELTKQVRYTLKYYIILYCGGSRWSHLILYIFTYIRIRNLPYLSLFSYTLFYFIARTFGQEGRNGSLCPTTTSTEH